MYLANRVLTGRAICFCLAALLTLDYAQAADDASNSQIGPEGQVPGVEKSVLSQKTNPPSKAAAGTQDFCKCINESDSDSARNIEKALRTPLNSTGLDFTETPLQAVVSQLQDDYGIPIQLDTNALEATGVRPDEQVTINIHNVSLRAALRLVLNSLHLTYVTSNDVLMITTPEEAEKDLRICVYDVSSISGNRDAQLDDVINTILSCVATDTWAKNGGGQAEVRAIKPGMLVISQTAAIHEEIRDLVSTLRKMQPEAKPNQTAGREAGPNNSVVTRSYVLQLQPNRSDNVRNQVRELILASLPNETWSGRLGDGQAVTLNVIHDRVVVRHTSAVQEEVERILNDSGIAIPASAVAANSNSGGLGGGMGGGSNGGGGFFRPKLNGQTPMSAFPGAPSESPWPRQFDPQPAGDNVGPEGATIKAGVRPTLADDPFAE